MALLFRVQRVLLLLALALSPPEAWPQEQNRTLLTGTIGTHSELRTADLALEARQHIEVTTDSSRISGLDVFVHDARSHELLARSEDQSREPFHWDVNQSGRFYLILRNITDTPIAYSVRSSAPRAVYHATVSPESATVEIFYATDRVTLDAAGSDQVAFGSEPADKLHLGTCKVSIPRDHRMGELEGPSILRLEFRNDLAKHIVLVETKIEQPGQFFRQISERMAHSKAREALVFVHGFNTDFESAARRTAQLAYDLGFDGAPILYSWPSQGKVLGYNKDSRNAELSVPHLREFLDKLSSQQRIDRIHVIAHSMGNRVVVQALSSLTGSRHARVRQLALIAPDIDAHQFRVLATALKDAADHVTLYASSKDQALKASEMLQGYPRAGEGEPNLLVLPGIDTIDASAVDTSVIAWSHSYFADNKSILSDLFYLIRGNAAGERACLRSRRRSDGTYWAFVPALR